MSLCYLKQNQNYELKIVSFLTPELSQGALHNATVVLLWFGGFVLLSFI